MTPVFTAFTRSETVVLSSRLAASIGGKVTRNEVQHIHRIRCEIDRSIFVSHKKYASFAAAQKAADRLNKRANQ